MMDACGWFRLSFAGASWRRCRFSARRLSKSRRSSTFSMNFLRTEGSLRLSKCPSFRAALQAAGRRVITTIHGIIPLEKIDGDFVRENAIPGTPAIAAYAWRTLIRSVAATANVVHVHEPQHYASLRQSYDVRKKPVEVVPLGVSTAQRRPDRLEARRSLGLKPDADVLLFFGFLSQYKGVEVIFREAPQMLDENRQLQFLIVGTAPRRLSATMAGKIQELRNLNARYPGRIISTGFLPEDRVGLAFAAADALMLPYTVNMSASGPLALAASYGIPILLSEVFSDGHSGCPHIFAIRAGAMAACVRRFFGSQQERRRAEEYVAHLRESTSWETVAHRMRRLYMAQ